MCYKTDDAIAKIRHVASLCPDGNHGGGGCVFFFSSRRRHTRLQGDWSSDVCSSDLEWPALWKVYHVDIEPFGKDHATPGGSRDSCKEIAESIMHFRAPMGIPYEWVGISDRGKDLGDMGSSDFLGLSPVQWVEVADPEVLRYIYAYNPIFRRIVLDLYRVDTYYDVYDRAEDLFYADV